MATPSKLGKRKGVSTWSILHKARRLWLPSWFGSSQPKPPMPVMITTDIPYAVKRPRGALKIKSVQAVQVDTVHLVLDNLNSHSQGAVVERFGEKA